MLTEVKLEEEDFPERQFSKNLKHTVEMVSIKPATFQMSRK